jgi:hypothetical protein
MPRSGKAAFPAALSHRKQTDTPAAFGKQYPYGEYRD